MNITEKDELILEMESLCNCAMRISGNTAGRKGVSWRLMIASIVFSRIALNSLSVLRLTPGSDFCPRIRGILSWDLPSVASLSRNLMESYFTLHYMLAALSTSREESLRENVWRYHETFERLKMLHLGVPSSAMIRGLEADLALTRRTIEQDQLFINLPKDLRSRVLKGEAARLKTNEELCGGAGISFAYFKSLFKYGSNHTHSSPFSIAQMDSFRPNDLEGVRVFHLAVKTAISFLALGIRDFVRAFSDQSGSLSTDENRLLAIWEEVVKWDSSPYFNRSWES